MEICASDKTMLQCSFGAAPSKFSVHPRGEDIHAVSVLTPNIMDTKPMCNILPFGMCSSLANPMVAAATAAAMGVLTPMPCIPMTVGPWLPGSSTVQINGMPALDTASKCMCTWGGVIRIVSSE